MKKILVSLLVALMVVLSISPCFAEEAPKEAGTTITIDNPTSDKINAAISASTGATTIVLNGDVTLDKQVVVPDGKIITIKGTPGANTTVKGTYNLFNTDMFMFYVDFAGQFTLGGGLTLDATATTRASLFVKSNGALVIDGCVMKNATCGRGITGAVFIEGMKASLNMKSGMITDCEIKNPLTGAVYLAGKSKGILNGGTIQKIENLGNNLRGQNQLGENSWCGTVVIDDATFEMNGGTIKDNTNKQGFISTAGVLVTAEQSDVSEDNAKKSYFTMNGGIISGNSSVDGGGVYVYGGDFDYKDFYSKAYFTMNGGTISGNTATGATLSNGSFEGGGGGGVFIYYGGEFTMNDGDITGNTSIGKGGGVATFDGFVGQYGKVSYSSKDGTMDNGKDMGKWYEYYPAKFTMNNGTISNNRAKGTSNGDNGCGGGVYIASAQNEINGGYIERNRASNQGGGIYVGSVPYEVYIYNSVITYNHADIGGGIWICPTGEVNAFIYDGTACFDNKADGAANEVAVVKNSNHHSIVLEDRMLGGGLANWYQDGAIDSSVLGNVDSSVPRYDPNGTSNVKVSVPKYSDIGLSLTLVPTNYAAIKLAYSKAKVYIRENTAVRGGAIGSNGSVYMGREKPEPIEATVIKKWNTDATSDKTTPDKVTVWLTIDGIKVESVELNKDNNWTHTFKGLPNDAKVTFTEEKVQGFTTTYSDMKQDEQTGNWEGTITNTKNKIPSYDPPVKKSIVGNAAAGDEYSFTLKGENANTPMPSGSKDGVKTVSIKGAGSTEFGDIFYEKKGTYIYSIEEVKGSIKNCTYDKTVYKLTVTVADKASGGAVANDAASGTLVATGVITKPDGTVVDTCEFTNTYAPKAVKTGDDSNLGIFAVLAALALAGLGLALLWKKIEENN